MSQLLISLKTNNNNSTAGHESVFNSEYSYLCLPSTLWHTMGTPRHTRDVTLWLSRTTDNSNFFIGSHEVRDNERRLYSEYKYEPDSDKFDLKSGGVLSLIYTDANFRPISREI